MSTQYDDPEQDEEQTGWPYQEVQDLDEAEREELLKQAGPVGEAVRMAWIAYQASQAAAGQGEPVPVPPSLQVPAQPHPEGGEDAPPPETTRSTRPEGVVSAGGPELDQGVDQTGSPTLRAEESGLSGDRDAAERKADERGLEIRDFGTAGDWRVYDPNTGRQVARSKLDEPIP